MADNWIQSFAVALGFDVDTSSLNTAKKSIADYEAAVKAAEKRIEDARWAGAKTEEEIAKLTRETNLKEAKEALAAAQAKEKAEKEAAQKREERNKAFTAGVEKMALAATAAATAIGYAVNRVTSAFDHLGFVSARTGASVQSLNSLGYAFKQVGGTSEQAVAAVESFTKAMRENSGVRGFVQGLGVDMTKDKADQLLDTVRILQGHGYDAGSREAGLAGISEENYALLTKYIDEIDRYRAEYNKLTASLGVDTKQATEASMAFHRSLTRLQATASALGDKLMVTLAPALKSIVDRFQEWIRSNPEKVGRIMNDISKALVWVAEKIAALVQTITGSDGEAFMKRWDAFAERAERFAHSVERIVSGFARLVGFVERLSGTRTFLGSGERTKELLEGLERDRAGGSGVPGVGAIGSFNPLQPGGSGTQADNRTWWQRHAPRWLGGKDAPSAAGGAPSGSSAGSLTALIEAEAKRAGIDPRIMHGIRAGESGHRADYDHNPGTPGRPEDSWGPFQLNRRSGLGVQFEKETGLDLRDPKTIAAQARWVAEYIAKGGSLRPWAGYHGPRDSDPKWGESGYAPTQVAGNTPPVNGVGGLEQNQGGAQHRRQALSDALQRQLIAAAKEVGVNVDAYSGGQDEDGPNRTGSHRHDHGNAADLRIYTLGQDGKRRYLDQRNDADRPIMEAFLRSAVKNGVTGIGAGPGYMGGSTNMHLGGGSVSAWGAGGSSAAAPDWVRRALEYGLQDRRQAAAEKREASASQPAQRAPNMTPGSFDVNALTRPDPALSPAVQNAIQNTTTSNRAVHQTFNTNTTIHEAKNVREAGRVMEGTFGRMHGLALENAQSAIA